jgi:hypothetical protein
MLNILKGLWQLVISFLFMIIFFIKMISFLKYLGLWLLSVLSVIFIAIACDDEPDEEEAPPVRKMSNNNYTVHISFSDKDGKTIVKTVTKAHYKGSKVLEKVVYDTLPRVEPKLEKWSGECEDASGNWKPCTGNDTIRGQYDVEVRVN